jgi:hypothetical protein
VPAAPTETSLDDDSAYQDEQVSPDGCFEPPLVFLCVGAEEGSQIRRPSIPSPCLVGGFCFRSPRSFSSITKIGVGDLRLNIVFVRPVCPGDYVDGDCAGRAGSCATHD